MNGLKVFKDYKETPTHRETQRDYEGYVYVVEYDGFVKIGMTINPQTRFAQLNLDAKKYCEHEIKRVALTPKHYNYTTNERVLHNYYNNYRRGRTEFFNIAFDDIVCEINNANLLEFIFLSDDERNDLKLKGEDVAKSVVNLLFNKNTNQLDIASEKSNLNCRELCELDGGANIDCSVSKRELIEMAVDTDGSIGMEDFVGILAFENPNISSDELFSWFEANDYLVDYDVPLQEYVDCGYFKVINQTYKTPYGVKTFPKTLVTGKGQIYLIEKLRNLF